MLPSCLPFYCIPSGPGTPFGTWWLIIADTVRVICVIMAIWLLGGIGAAWRRSYPRSGQRDRFTSLGLLAFVVIGAELQDLGNVPSYRLALSTVAMLLAIRGLLRFDHERPAAPR